MNILEYLYSINSNETWFNSFVDVVLIHCRQVFFAMNFKTICSFPSNEYKTRRGHWAIYYTSP